MKIFRPDNGRFTLARMSRGFKSWRLREKLLLALIPPVVCILVFTGYMTWWFSQQFLTEVLERNVRMQSLAISHEVEIFLEQCREDLLLLAQGLVSKERLVHFQNSRKIIRGYGYRELAFVSQKGREHTLVLADGEHLRILTGQDLAMIRPSPLLLADKLGKLRRNDVWISGVAETVYPFQPAGGKGAGASAKVIQLATPYFAAGDAAEGFVILGIDLLHIRSILSLYNSPRSPLFAVVRSPELRCSYFFDPEGWILFQSEDTEDEKQEVSTERARTGFSGTFGKPGLACAFRPYAEHGHYWQMVEDVQKGKHGVMRVKDTGKQAESWTDYYFLGYAPVHFSRGSGQQPVTIGGIAFADRSRVTLWAGYRQIDVMFVISLVTIIIISLLIFVLSRVITRPILALARAVNQIQQTGKLEEIHIDDHDHETSFLKTAINNMINTMKTQMEEIQVKDEKIRLEGLREKARLQEEVSALKRRLQTQDVGEIVGLGPVIENLKSEILRAASVDADVLITGETGTGKQLTAEAIHRHSSRHGGPFISINCGALDENLLLDTLFGHVKGAFTEAKTERKGAFLAAHGGTLFLDEIGAASLKVQQSLLRAISMRKFRPLGSDREIGVDVRVIAASNLDLKDMIAKGLFREDLYYRLAVIMIRTPALREQSENIPVLVEHFLREAARHMKREVLGLSRGCLEKLKNHHWPGNVRELENCIIRAVAMAERGLIHSEDVQLEGEKSIPHTRTTGGVNPLEFQRQQGVQRDNSAIAMELNARQRKALPVILENGEISRAEYQQVVGNGLPVRTAIYDLQDLVRKGFLKKTGRGPATRYFLANLPDFAR